MKNRNCEIDYELLKKKASFQVISLISLMLTPSYGKRISAQEALNQNFFNSKFDEFEDDILSIDLRENCGLYKNMNNFNSKLIL